MNARLSLTVIVLAAAIASPARAQGFAGIGAQADGFTQPRPNPQFSFPADHGPHDDFKIEWWYLTANLRGPTGAPFGLQWTLFRTALTAEASSFAQSDWSSTQIWFGHAAVTTPSKHYVAERFARGGIGQAGVKVAPFSAWIDEWEMSGESFDTMSLKAAGPQFAYDVNLLATKPLVFHGQGGYSVKSAQGQASYYYSQPSFEVTGTLKLPGGEVLVTGTAWLDREWSSQPLAANQTGWDWFSLSFDDGSKLMTFRLRQNDGEFYASATWIDADGKSKTLEDGAVTATPLALTTVAEREVPTRWALQIPGQAVNIVVDALNPKAWLTTAVPYWEGPVTISGSHTGAGYLEMTGYE